MTLHRYQLDPTGINPDNAVVGEVHTLINKPNRAFAPTYGPFFTNRLIVYDNITNRTLVKGVDYQCVELLQEATYKFGNEISNVILIINSEVNTEVRINYQTLGGLYQNNADNLIELYNTAINDSRGVDWANVMNKPMDYMPSIHNHLLDDIVGFEPVITALERIRNAIVLSDVPAFEAVMQWVRNRVPEIVTRADIDAQNPVMKMVTFDKLMYALNILNFNGITLTPNITTLGRRSTVQFHLSSTNTIDHTKLYWSIIHNKTTDADFLLPSGSIVMKGNEGSFELTTTIRATSELNKSFVVAIRSNNITGPILTKTQPILLTDGANADIIDLMNTCCLFSPLIDRTPEALFLVKERCS